MNQPVWMGEHPNFWVISDKTRLRRCCGSETNSKKWWHLTPCTTNIVPETEWLEDVIFFGGEGVFVKLHVTGSPCFVICFVCLSTPAGWDFSLNHQQLNSYDLFLMPKPNHGNPVFNVQEYPWKFTTKFLCFFRTGQNAPNKVAPNMISLPEN